MDRSGSKMESKIPPLFGPVYEFASDNWMRISGFLAVVGVSWGLIGGNPVQAGTIEGKKFIPPEGSYRKIPRYKRMNTSEKALENILQEFNEDVVDLTPMPAMSENDMNAYKSCMFGKAGKVFMKGDIETARIDDDSVGIALSLVDDCQKHREIRAVIGIESREDNKKDFKPVITPAGIIKYVGGSPEYGSYYFDDFGQSGSCATNPDLEVRFSVDTVARSNYAPSTIRSASVNRMPIIDCEIG